MGRVIFIFGFSYVLIVITARLPLKLAMLATSFDIPATICPLVFYSHINAISSLSRDFNFTMAASDFLIFSSDWTSISSAWPSIQSNQVLNY